MRTFDVEILIVPGYGNSGPDHWQTRWQSRLKSARRVEQDHWKQPDAKLWPARIVAAVAAAQKPVILIAHSCGVAAVAHAASKLTAGRVAGAFLVAPAAESVAAKLPGVDPAFTPYPRDPFPFPSLLVASRDDKQCPYEAAGDMALDWGSTLVDAGSVGHINTESGHGPWPEGAMRFGWFLKQLGGAKTK